MATLFEPTITPNDAFANVAATIPASDDPANIVTAFQEYHNDIASYISSRANVANPTFTGSTVTFEGATANDFETTITITDPTADRALVIPDEAGTFVLKTSGVATVNITGTASNATAVVHYKSSSGGDYTATTPTNKIFTGQTQPTSGMTVGDIWMW
jgi:hypothetical protein